MKSKLFKRKLWNHLSWVLCPICGSEEKIYRTRLLWALLWITACWFTFANLHRSNRHNRGWKRITVNIAAYIFTPFLRGLRNSWIWQLPISASVMCKKRTQISEFWDDRFSDICFFGKTSWTKTIFQNQIL